uniref:Pentatricopeptide repeat-containing protein n=1 Tax=Ananas comosus var. bracteatus TaxID=296719 RepID=A0A6V7P0W7_ANACO|nr:unnamed protein product [Ananas comosus var. bracteatus]
MLPSSSSSSSSRSLLHRLLHHHRHRHRHLLLLPFSSSPSPHPRSPSSHHPPHPRIPPLRPHQALQIPHHALSLSAASPPTLLLLLLLPLRPPLRLRRRPPIHLTPTLLPSDPPSDDHWNDAVESNLNALNPNYPRISSPRSSESSAIAPSRLWASSAGPVPVLATRTALWRTTRWPAPSAAGIHRAILELDRGNEAGVARHGYRHLRQALAALPEVLDDEGGGGALRAHDGRALQAGRAGLRHPFTAHRDEQRPDLELVYRVVRKYESAGYSLSKAVYDGIHRSLTSNGRFGEAEEIVEKMRSEGFEPDNITYSQLVYGLCKARRFDDAYKVFDEMEAAGCVPDLKTWTVLIQGHCTAGEVDKGLECLARMIEKNCEADADVLDILVKGLCGKSKAEGAYNLFDEMVERARLRPSKTFRRFADPFPPYIAKFGTIDDARQFLKALTVNNYPSPAAYLNVFKAFFDEGRYSEAQDLLFKCPHHIRKHADISKLFGSIKPENSS